MLKEKLKSLADKTFLKNKPISFKIGRFNLLCERQHSLPRILAKYTDYGKNIVSLAVIIFKKYPNSSIIDIGANIGDTAISITNELQVPIACIDGDETFFKYLKTNTKTIENITCYKTFLCDESGNLKGIVNRKNGTAQITQNDNLGGVNTTTLDDFLTTNRQWEKSKLLKIDTDGFDLKILRGGINYIRNTKPILFFEYDRVSLEQNGEKGLDIFEDLRKIGYNKIIFYDNYGRYILDTGLENNKLIGTLHYYTCGKRNAFPYYDITIFHRDDNDIAETFSKQESEKRNSS